jgi:hypothetical protein
VPAGSPAHSQGGEDKRAEEYHDPDEQQEQQPLGDHPDDAEDYCRNHQQQEQRNHRSSISRRSLDTGQPAQAVTGPLVHRDRRDLRQGGREPRFSLTAMAVFTPHQ